MSRHARRGRGRIAWALLAGVLVAIIVALVVASAWYEREGRLDGMVITGSALMAGILAAAITYRFR